jgi:hypothetical protein
MMDRGRSKERSVFLIFVGRFHGKSLISEAESRKRVRNGKGNRNRNRGRVPLSEGFPKHH